MREEKKRHYTKEPIYIIKKALEKEGYLHAAALSMVTGKSISNSMSLLTGEIPIRGNGLPKIAKALGIDREDLV